MKITSKKRGGGRGGREEGKNFTWNIFGHWFWSSSSSTGVCVFATRALCCKRHFQKKKKYQTSERELKVMTLAMFFFLGGSGHGYGDGGNVNSIFFVNELFFSWKHSLSLPVFDCVHLYLSSGFFFFFSIVFIGTSVFWVVVVVNSQTNRLEQSGRTISLSAEVREKFKQKRERKKGGKRVRPQPTRAQQSMKFRPFPEKDDPMYGQERATI